MTSAYTFDVAVVGAGPVGSVTALAFARKGARVLLLEANPAAAGRFAGEWLHPPALETMRSLGIPVPKSGREGRGFVVMPDESIDPFVLSYADGTRGLSCEHHELVDAIRSVAVDHPNVTYHAHARVSEATDHRLTFIKKKSRSAVTVSAGLIVGADGRSSVVRTALGLPVEHVTSSRMAGLLLSDCEMPFEGFGHVFLGGPGPVLAYRIAPEVVRMCIDVPLHQHRAGGRERNTWLLDAYGPVLPASLRGAFERSLRSGQVAWAANQVRPRLHYGRENMVLVGDAVGHHHPLTAAGMTLGFGDALELARARSFEQFRRRRLRDTRVPEMLAVALYEVFADHSDETVAIRRSVYSMWRRSAAERTRTMRFLACQDKRVPSFAYSFLQALTRGAVELTVEASRSGFVKHRFGVARSLFTRARYLSAGILRKTAAIEAMRDRAESHSPELRAALNVSIPVAEVVDLELRKQRTDEFEAPRVDPRIAIERGARALGAHQRAEGQWEGEVVWCPMLPAQYVMMCHVTGTPIPEARRRLLVRQFEATQLPGSGLWGLHEHSEPYLFVTTLVYVAARLLGVEADAPLLAPARRFLREQGGAVAIPSWGKFWLALVNLYSWDGVNAILPEVWALPRSFPLHPGNYYCHTRLIYMAMAALFGRRVQAPLTPIIEALRQELFPTRGGFAAVDWARARNTLRDEEIFTPHSVWLKALYRATIGIDRMHVPAMRERIVADLYERIRWEMRTTDHTCISPVNGLLNIVALWHDDPNDPDLARALEQFEGWIWEDEHEGMRIAGARSASWDSAFALQALATVRAHTDVETEIERGIDFIRSQQIQRSFPGFAENYRVDPRGGWCFAGVWHGWPVSDCTAEAMLALLETQAEPDRDALEQGARFILQCQNPDGGFGSYEASKLPFKLEWINPAEMFGNSMTEHSYPECTASCIAALSAFRKHFPTTALADEIDLAVARAAERLRLLQRPDGSWEGVWGVHFIYGTMFGVRGLLAAGASPVDPAITKACRWLLARQRPDGGWGEHHSSCLTGQYKEHDSSHVTQSAWALTTLLEAQCPQWDAIERGAQFLARTQHEDGEWPRQDMAGVFFHTALLEYTLYRRYFPLQALGLYETRRRARAGTSVEARAAGRRKHVAQPA